MDYTNIGITSVEFSKTLAAIMKKKKVSSSVLAKRMNENRAYIDVLKKGKRVSVKLNTIIRFADALGVNLAVFSGCIRKEFVRKDDVGVTNELFTKTLANELLVKRISYKELAKRLDCDELEAVELILGIKYKVDIPTLLKIVEVIDAKNERFWRCLDF